MFIRIPAPLVLSSGDVFAFAAFVASLLNTDDRFNRTGVGIRAAVRVEQALVAADGCLDLGRDEWDLLRAAAEAPQQNGQPGAYVLSPARALAPFLAAITEATETRPAQSIESPAEATAS